MADMLAQLVVPGATWGPGHHLRYPGLGLARGYADVPGSPLRGLSPG